MILLDTTVLVYAVGGDHPLRAPAAALVEAVGRGAAQATTTVEVIQEFTHVRARRRGRSDAADLAAEYAALLAPLTPATSADLAAGLRLFRDANEIGCSDAVLAAVARRRSASLVTADRSLLAELDGTIDLAHAAETLLGP